MVLRLVELQTATKPRIFYGWWMVFIAALINFVGYGTSFWAFGVFVAPLESQFGWSRAEISAAMSINFLVAGFAGPLIGAMADSLGLKRVLVYGSVVMAGGFVFLYTMSSLWQLYTGFAVMSLGRAAVTFIPMSILIGNWFVKKRGMALGVSAVGGGLAGVILVPVFAQVITVLGWQFTFLVLAATASLIIVPLALWGVKANPKDLGLEPDGTKNSAHLETAVSSPDWPPEKEALPFEPAEWTWQAALRSRTFWLISIAFSLAYFGQVSVVVHLLPYMVSRGNSAQDAAVFVSIGAGISIAGRLLGGYASDRLSVKKVLLLCFSAQTAGLLLLTIGGSDNLVLWAFLILFNTATGGVPTIEPAIIIERFGMRGLGVLLGALGIVETVGITAGPFFAGYVFDLTSSYQTAFAVFVVSYLIAMASLALAGQARRSVSRSVT